MALLEPNEQTVADMMAAGLTNEQIADRLGFRDKRTISRVNGQIYAAWDLKHTSADEKIARTRATIIALTGQLIRWDDDGNGYVLNERDQWISWTVSLRMTSCHLLAGHPVSPWMSPVALPPELEPPSTDAS